jgi:biotin carboxyl carrier protein
MENLKIFKATVNEQFVFETLNDDIDELAVGDGHFHVLKDGISYKAELISADYNAKQLVIRVNGIHYDVKLEDQYDQLVDRLGLTISSGHEVKDIYAPMPGLVLDIAVSKGQEVEEGTPLLILEAMKMENVIKSPGKGVIKSINVKQGEAVEKSQLLIEME